MSQLQELMRYVNAYTPCLNCGACLFWRHSAHHVEGEELILACAECGRGTAVSIPRVLPRDATITLLPDSGGNGGRLRDLAPGAAILAYGRWRRAVIAEGSPRIGGVNR